MPPVVLVALGGAAGTLGRYGLDESVGAGAWPWSTLLVNLVGSAALGLLVGLGPSGDVRLFVGTGVLGGFTTYSAFAVQTDDFLRDGDPLGALGYAGVTVVGGAVLALLALRTSERRR